MTTSQIATPKGAIMARKSRNIIVTILASNGDEAIRLYNASPAAKRLGDQVVSVSPVGFKSERHHLYNLEMVLSADANADQVWVWVTSYGMSPCKALGSKLGAACERMADAQA